MSRSKNEFRLDDDGKLDDVVVHDVDTFRLERMSDNSWWACVYLRDGSRVHFGIGAKRAMVEATHWFDRIEAPKAKRRNR
jgi:hypothetical protein